MKSATAIVLFYGLLALATAILRGDLTNWPRWADRLASFAVAWSAVILLVKCWQPAHPPAETPSGPPARMAPNWQWWAGVLGFLAFLFLFALPPVSTWLAQPQKIERSSTGRHQSQSPAPASADAPDPATPLPDGGTILPGHETGTPSASAASGPAGSSLLDRLRGLWRDKTPWLRWLAIAVAVVLIAALAWALRRVLRPTGDRPPPRPAARPPWFDDPRAPRYVREFARLCHQLGCPPHPGETFRDLLAHLSRDGHDIIELMPMTAYHYRVRYENARPDPAAERIFTGILRAHRKAPTSAPATATATAASTAH